MRKFFDSKYEKIVLMKIIFKFEFMLVYLKSIIIYNFIKTTKNNAILCMDMIKTGELAGPKQNVCKHSKQH